ncbi:hypothetical protein BDR06DRAFT_1022394 [Suillus hirtellus]|nr:hypothetical protein BDR06DRAFT_1022394 [Suillus hirtellus]
MSPFRDSVYHKIEALSPHVYPPTLPYYTTSTLIDQRLSTSARWESAQKWRGANHLPPRLYIGARRGTFHRTRYGVAARWSVADHPPSSFDTRRFIYGPFIPSSHSLIEASLHIAITTSRTSSSSCSSPVPSENWATTRRGHESDRGGINLHFPVVSHVAITGN